ncbi:MAG: DUF177 domain-containing protein [Actinobacteria bacterium]|nr:DUF177 domain-containing protein [Actinomycetota bacterium]
MPPKEMTAVREARSLLIDVSELLRSPGSSRRLELEEEVAGLAVPMAHVAGAPVLDLLAERVVEGILISGTVSGALELECIRCLTEVEDVFSVPVSELFATGEIAPGDEVYPVEGDHIDLEPMVRDAVVLGLPLNPLCRPDCKGLCPQCGQDLNEADCGHRPERIDVRWEPLRRLKETMGE